ncbi:Glycosyltransferase, catalytic subunit of cellulose synthase and poly-beta-1,6-N-acetylglucosamine synthase [Desulfocicer vacuolatum DSM 3385]|uniref:Glycosyltransferase, catalytic subunit of cellulose synthase and poly-beta-1,6-N-acetylglucosamine synthase n=1 Tax=Desulfocicer vacuolatum DSM 3385 TaxID=1121400 RepID=A0A1W2DNU5_9BACT|nr:glycosyltransferase family 2 protein [Desulfocicer vacuolatum]SMC99099.1 Glycosyltransferase, catalytic subunit of cellulose synthase and poly-beta-1,6-N-acetylglucosamine synthase [Desulfocicer vacuolatum DSM 3385]
MILIDLIFYPMAAYILLTTGYLFFLTMAAWFFKKKTVPDGKISSVTVVIPAHNEALGITQTIESIKAADFPHDQCRIVVIADNCNDDTAGVARNAGAVVMERTDTQNRGKGQALDWFFKNHKNRYDTMDSVAIIDADTLIHPQFFTEICNSLSHPEVQVVQGFYGVSNPRVNWRTALSSAALCVFHHIRPAGRNKINATAGLKGNGMAFKTDIIQKFGWPAFSIVEDIEFSIHLLLENILVHYNPDAIVLGEMASKSDQAKTQRKRWEGGRIQLLKQYTGSLVLTFMGKRNFMFIDAFMELFTPPLSLVVAGQVFLFAISFIFYPHALILWGLCLYATVLYVFSGLILKKAPFYVWQSLFCAPFFILWKIPVYFKLAGKKGIPEWERTKRAAEINEDTDK